MNTSSSASSGNEKLAQLLSFYLSVAARLFCAHKFTWSAVTGESHCSPSAHKKSSVCQHSSIRLADNPLVSACNKNTHKNPANLQHSESHHKKKKKVFTCPLGKVLWSPNFIWLPQVLLHLDVQVMGQNAFVQCLHYNARMWLVLSAVHYVEL